MLWNRGKLKCGTSQKHSHIPANTHNYAIEYRINYNDMLDAVYL